MGELPLSLHLKPEVMEGLEREARLLDLSEAEVAKRAIADFLEMQAHRREAIGDAIAEADKGIFISGEAMHRWIESWGTENELPPPEPDIFPDDRR